jgi:hypothetical protein
LLYLAVEGYSDGPGSYPGVRSELGIWDAKRLIDAAREDGTLEFFTPAGTEKAEVADGLLQVLVKWRAFRFPRHEAGSQPAVTQGDRVLVIRGRVNQEWFAAAKAEMQAGRTPAEEAGVKKRPHVIFGRGSKRLRVAVHFEFSLYTA